MEKDGDAMESDGDAMEKDGDAMESDGDAMEKDGDAMESDGDAMEKSGDAMESDTVALAGAGDEPAAMAAKRRGKRIKVVNSQFGRVIADGKGEALYLFDKEKTKRARCYGACAAAWPPVLTKGRPRAGRGAKAGKLGTTRRRDGRRQVTYNGHPLYYYVDDAPGTILCHDVFEYGGLWLVVNPSGRAVG